MPRQGVKSRSQHISLENVRPKQNEFGKFSKFSFEKIYSIIGLKVSLVPYNILSWCCKKRQGSSIGDGIHILLRFSWTLMVNKGQSFLEGCTGPR